MITRTLQGFPAAMLLLLIAMPAAAQKAEDSSIPANAGWVARWNTHPEITWPGKLRVEFRARIQRDGSVSDAPVADGKAGDTDQEKRRIGVAGEIGGVLEFQLERELTSTDPWRDAFVNYRGMRRLQIQAGQFKLPFGLEETTSRTALDFISRSLVSDRLAPGRDLGLMLHGRLARKSVGYEAGLFGHDGDNARPNGGRRVFGGRTFAGRLTVEPFRRSKSVLSDMELGVAATRSSLPQGFPGIRGKSVLGVSFFPSDLWVKGSRLRTGLQARWRPGPFSVASELIRLSDDRRGQSQENTDLSPFLAHGWYVSGTWVVAGASRASKVAEPSRPLFHGGFGSIQLAMRLERLALGSASGLELPSTSPRAESVLGNRDTATTLGLTWHPNRWVTIEGNVVREAIGEAAHGPLPQMRVWSRLVRFQFAL